MKKPFKIGLALGAGGSKGLAHIGVIKVLEKYGIPVDFIAGSSVGALVGGMYASQKDIKHIEHIALSHNWPQILPLFLDPTIFQGFIAGGKIQQFIQKNIGDITFEQTRIPFAALATNLKNGKTTALKTGRLAEGIRASISFPLIFKPFNIENNLYIDGGVSMPVPVDVVRHMGADFVIAVNLESHIDESDRNETYGMQKIANKSIDILGHYLSLENIKHADFVISPNVRRFGMFDKFLTEAGTREVIEIGEKEMEGKIGLLQGMIREREMNGIEKVLQYLKNIFIHK
jgi:NTE family protein